MFYYMIFLTMASELGTPRINISLESQAISHEEQTPATEISSISPVNSESSNENNPYLDGLRLLKNGYNDEAIKLLHDSVMNTENLKAATSILSQILTFRLKIEDKNFAYEAMLDACHIIISKTNDSNIMNTLGLIYERGYLPDFEKEKGDEYTRNEALFWYQEAARSGSKLGYENLSKLKKQTQQTIQA